MRLLLVEDTARLIELMTEAVHDAGWQIDAVTTVQDAEEVLATTPYDLLLFDLGLPDGDGLDLVGHARKMGIQTPILVITARNNIEDRIRGLDAGADDYLVKPFNTRELLARCRALLRRSPHTDMPVLSAGSLIFDVAKGTVSCGSDLLVLSPREQAVLGILMREVGAVVPKRTIEHALSEFGEELSSNAIELAISRLRKKLETVQTGIMLETVRGIGYLLHEISE